MSKARRPSNFRSWLLLPVVLLAAACGNASRVKSVGLFTSLPIQWREAGDVRDLLREGPPPHWALAVLQSEGELRPVDSLLPGRNHSPLKDSAILVVAQPRPLAPQENVALDAWVRKGGRLLLFADPMLTQESAFALGDKRRPESIAMLSPILSRWGLRLHFDEDKALGERRVELYGAVVPVDLPGTFAPDGPARHCTFDGGGIAVQCRVGRGKVLALADAALLDVGAGSEFERAAALSSLLDVLKRMP